MSSTALSYFDAGLDHLSQALWLHDQEHYYLSHYHSGLAVECMLRAYMRRLMVQFRARHDLNLIATDGQFYDLVPDDEVAEWSSRIAAVNLRWRSNERYMGETELWSYLDGLKHDQGMVGRQAEHESHLLLRRAFAIVMLGRMKWDS